MNPLSTQPEKKLKLAFCLFVYRPHGGLQRSFVRIAQMCQQRGHHIRVYCMQWQGPQIPDFDLHLIEPGKRSNHARSHHFAQKVQRHLLANEVDVVIGFNRMPGLNLYYAADPCYVAKQAHRSLWYRWAPRYRRFASSERAVFSNKFGTHILAVSEREIRKFQHHYQTPSSRIHLLPPGIDKDRCRPEEAIALERRTQFREHLGVLPGVKMILMIGSGFETKGVDRALHALAALPPSLKDSQLFILGKGHVQKFVAIAKRIKVNKNCHFMGGRDDVPEFLLAADLLIHPARSENTGNSLLEATVAGLPVLTSEVCGYSGHIEEAGSGTVLPADFTQKQLDGALSEMLLSSELSTWSKNGVQYGQQSDLYSRAEAGTVLIEAFANGSLDD